MVYKILMLYMFIYILYCFIYCNSIELIIIKIFVINENKFYLFNIHSFLHNKQQ